MASKLGVTALYVTPTQESGGPLTPRTPQDRHHCGKLYSLLSAYFLINILAKIIKIQRRMDESAHTQTPVWMKTMHLTAAATIHCVPENVHLFNSELSKINRFFGMLNPEIILHKTLTDLSTSPVKCSHCEIFMSNFLRI